MLNASIASIQSGLRPTAVYRDKYGREYFIFGNLQWRRQIGEGHSSAERKARREKVNADHRIRREYKRGRAGDGGFGETALP